MSASSIRVSDDLREAIKDLGEKGDSYEDILWRELPLDE